MANNVIGSLIVNLGLETGRLNSDTKKAANHFNSFDKKASLALNNVKNRANGLMAALGGLTGVAGVLSVAGLGALAKSSIDSADKIGKLSDRLGASTEALSQYSHVAELSGIRFETLTMGWQRMTRRVAEAASGFGEARGALQELNLSASDLNQLKPEQQFEIIADALSKVDNQADKVRLSMKLFDSEGVSLLQTMTQGAAGIREMRDEANELGLTLSHDDALGAAKANDALTRLKASSKALGQVMARSLGPVIADIANWLSVNLPGAVQFAVDGFKALRHFALEVVQKITDGLGKFYGALSLIPGSVGDTYKRAQQSMQGFSAHIEDMQQKMALAVGTAKEFKATTGGAELPEISGASSTSSDEKTEEEKKRLNDRLQIRLDALNTSLMTEEQRLFESHENRQVIVNTAFENELITKEKQKELLLSLETDFEEKHTAIVKKGLTERQKFEAMTNKQKLRTQIAMGVQMTQGVANTSRTMFNINKKLALADAAVKLPSAVIKSFDNGGGYPWGLIPAGLMLATGLAQINAIKSTSFGGGGSAPSLAGGGGGSSTVNTVSLDSQEQSSIPEARPTTINATLVGGMFDSASVRDFIGLINDELGDGVDLNVTVAA